MRLLSRSFCFICLGFSALLFQSGPAAALWPFPPKRFKGNALLSAGSLGLDKLDGRIVAFGDFDGNQFLDVMSLSEDQQTIRVHLWDHDAFEFRPSNQLSLGRRIVNVIPADYNRDGRLDILVMCESRTPEVLDLFLYLGVEGGFDSNVITPPQSTDAQPLLIDAFGEMKVDLLGVAPSLVGHSGLTLWNNTRSGGDVGPEFFHLVDAPLQGTACIISSPHSNAIVDFDGDCLGDVFLTCGSHSHKSFQIWTNIKGRGFTLSRSGSFPENTGAISFADMNRDGTIDMIFPTCLSVSMSTGIGTGCKINIVYNQQKPLCASTSGASGLGQTNYCRRPDNLCSSDPDFQFDFNQGIVSYDLAELTPDQSDSLLLYDITTSPPIPIPIRIGDLDLDGFPDLVPIVVQKRDRSWTTPILLFSVSCRRGLAGCSGNKLSSGRSYKVMTKNTQELYDIKDARGVALLDLDEDGTLDLMVQRTGKQMGTKVTFIQNNFFHDAFFLKAIVLNGACVGWCIPEHSNETKYHPFGVAYSGPSYKYTVIDPNGYRSAAQVGQLPQTSYHALQTPYAFFGLGRTNNYIENLFVGSTKTQTYHYINMEGVIPNSKVVISPPIGNRQPSDWKKELYLRPGEWIPVVSLTVVIATLVLAIIWFILHLNEKREDELERRRKLHHINFDAL